ncbi:MAG: hypothetical protein EPN30_04245 [Actinomycetota bacterium]|nr:MAG: hypothetical protein EPN30_04245 [Actinomycetota bacterium]
MFKDIDVNALIAMLGQTDIGVVTIKSQDFEIVLSRELLSNFDDKAGEFTPQIKEAPSPAQTADFTSQILISEADALQTDEVLAPHSILSPELAPNPAELVRTNDSLAPHIVRAPLVGIFYRASAPGAPPFVETNQKVDPETTIGLLETMKVFTAVQAGKRGIIKEILADNGQMLELDAPILTIGET